MADWTDGPEYAPGERPAAFVAPVAEKLSNPAPVQLLEPGVPGEEPGFAPPSTPTPALEALVPAVEPGRNPNAPFESLTTSLTTLAVTTTQRSPQEPFQTTAGPITGYLPMEPTVAASAQLNPAPFPTAPLWVGPTPHQAPPVPDSPSLGQVLQATTAWVLIPLVIGMFALPIAPVALLVAWIASAQVKYRRVAVRRGFLIIEMLVAGIWMISVLGDSSLDLWGTFALLSLIACWILVAVTLTTVWSAIHRQEPPERL
jgi:hypothetical protein